MIPFRAKRKEKKKKTKIKLSIYPNILACSLGVWGSLYKRGHSQRDHFLQQRPRDSGGHTDSGVRQTWVWTLVLLSTVTWSGAKLLKHFESVSSSVNCRAVILQADVCVRWVLNIYRGGYFMIMQESEVKNRKWQGKQHCTLPSVSMMGLSLDRACWRVLLGV